MKNIFKLIFTITIFIFAQNTFAEEIKNYVVDIELHTDSSMTITETIDYDFGNLQKHGIFRFIPLYFEVDGQKKMYGLQQRELQFENLSVKRNGVSETYTKKVKDKNGNYFIKIGKPNETITGIHSYEIKYDVLGSVRYFEDYDEVYWNAIGLDWKILIKNSEINIHSKEIEFKDFSCYTGYVGSQNQCQSANRKSKNAVQFLEKNLNSHQGFTVAASFDKGAITRNEFFGFTTKALILAIVGIILTIGITLTRFIRGYQRKYFVHDPIHPRYTPPENLDAIFTGYITDKVLHPRDISAGIIQLARDGYIEIEKIENTSFFRSSSDYSLTLIKELVEVENESYKIKKSILQLLFSKTQNIASFLNGISSNNSIGECVGSHVLLSEISKRNDRTQHSFIDTIIKKYFLSEGLFEQRSQKNNGYVLIPFVLTFITFIMGNIVFGFIMFFITFISIFMLATINLRYTEKGWKTKHAIEGFKLFLEMTERDRYEFFNNPADNSQEFMEYLPYAIALGVEKKWAKQFESITIPQPEWYKGSGPFVAAGFAHEMSSFSKSVTSSVATKTSSGSGSHGGGSSGGGSGGGGGGSW